MSFPLRLLRRAWLLVLPLAAAFIVWLALARIEHIRQVTDLAEWSVDRPAPDPNSPTGYANGARRLILPQHDNEAYQWIAQTQQTLAGGDWRLNHVDYDNAPEGRAVVAPSLYRWWLSGLSWVEHAFSGKSLALSAEDAALWAGPLLQLLLLVSAAGFVARAFGALAATLVALGVIGFFPLGGAFVAGSPNPEALALICAVWSLLPIVASVRDLQRAGETETGAAAKRARRCFGVAGVAGGIGLWVNVDYQWQLLVGIAAGGALAAWVGRAKDRISAVPPPWFWWGLCGSATSLLAYAAEYFPGDMAMRFDANHPLFALSWLGVSGLLACLTPYFGDGKRPASSRWPRVKLALASAGALAAPIAIAWAGERSGLPDHPGSARLAGEAGGVAATSFGAWVARDGFNATAWAACLPLLVVAVGVCIASSRRSSGALRASVIIALGPTLIATLIAWQQLRAWSFLDAGALALAAALVAADAASARRRGLQWIAAATALVAATGLLRYWPRASGGESASFSEVEVQGVIERDLAHWLARRAGSPGAIVLAPPNLTTSLFFHGGLRGIGTLDPENRDGFAAATRMASATSRDEAATLLQQRDVAYIVVPSWDPFLQEYAQLGLRAAPGSGLYEKSFIAGLQRWNLPRWLRPVPYRLPNGTGFSEKSAAVFEVVPEQDAPTALARLADYFIEMGRLDLAASLRDDLKRYPADIGALAALAGIEATTGDAAAFHRVVETLQPFVVAGADRRLPWDRRLALAVVLAQARQIDLAREQVRRCAVQADETKLRSLTTASLVRLFALCKMTGTEFSDPKLKELGTNLLPPDLRHGVQ